MNHVKPTQEELDAKIAADIAEAESLSKQTPEPEEEPVIVEPTEIDPIDEVAPVEPSEPDNEEPQTDPSEEAKEKLKNKLSASARENQKIYAKNRVINQALSDAEDIPEPTEEELSKEYADWDEMSSTEKLLAKETLVSKKWRQTISEAKNKAAKIEKWEESIDSFVDDPKTFVDFPDLEGKQDRFRKFASEETNNSVPFNILVAAFLHNVQSEKPSNKGGMFVSTGGGPNDKGQSVKRQLTMEEGRQLRENNYSKWKELLNADRIESNI